MKDYFTRNENSFLNLCKKGCWLNFLSLHQLEKRNNWVVLIALKLDLNSRRLTEIIAETGLKDKKEDNRAEFF